MYECINLNKIIIFKNFIDNTFIIFCSYYWHKEL